MMLMKIHQERLGGTGIYFEAQAALECGLRGNMMLAARCGYGRNSPVANTICNVL